MTDSTKGPFGEKQVLLPPDWPRPSGYSHAVAASGRQLVLAGQIGWKPETGRFESDDLVDQSRQALANIMTLLEHAGARPEDLVRLTWYVTSRDEYMASRKRLGEVYRAVMGRNYPPMSVVFVSALVEERAKVEIEATAVIPG